MITTPSYWRMPVIWLTAFMFAALGLVTAASPRGTAAVPSGGTVIAAEAEFQGTLDPLQNNALATSDIVSPVFDSLVYIDQNGNFQNDLATQYTHDKLGLHWKFYLNPQAKWQDGVPVTAKDVVYTTNLVNTPAFGAVNTTGYDHVKTITAIGNSEVDVTLTSVYAPFLDSWGIGVIMPEHILGKIAPDKIKNDTAFNQKPLGSGPFQITEYAPGDHITEVANKSYFRGAPHLDKIIFRIVPNNNTAINQLQTGEINLIGQTSALSARQFNLLKRLPNVTAYNTPGFNWSHIDPIETGFFKDRTVRQALAYATPKQQIIDFVELGYGTIADADQAPGTPWYNPAVRNSYPYNPTRAKSLLLSDGFTVGPDGIPRKGGKPLSIVLWSDTSSSDTKLIVQILKQAWSKVGIDTTIKLIDSSILFGTNVGPLDSPDRFSSPNQNAALYQWVASAEPDDAFLWASNQIPNKQSTAGGNSVGYRNPELDKLMAQGVGTVDQGQRAAIYRRIQAILARDQPDIFLFWGRVLTAASSKLHGYIPQPYTYLLGWNAKDWYMTQ